MLRILLTYSFLSLCVILKKFGRDLSNQSLLLRTDLMTAIAYTEEETANVAEEVAKFAKYHLVGHQYIKQSPVPRFIAPEVGCL